MNEKKTTITQKAKLTTLELYQERGERNWEPLIGRQHKTKEWGEKGNEKPKT